MKKKYISKYPRHQVGVGNAKAVQFRNFIYETEDKDIQQGIESSPEFERRNIVLAGQEDSPPPPITKINATLGATGSKHIEGQENLSAPITAQPSYLDQMEQQANKRPGRPKGAKNKK